LLSRHLVTDGMPDPDLFIRTGGEKRISNFLIWQLAYTELYFTDVLWPDFSKQNFADALQWFAKRERRFGKTSEQILSQAQENRHSEVSK
jgi:undecaprenyl diphosphate synthase